MLGWITKYVEWYRRGSKDEREREGEIYKEKERDLKAAGKDGGGRKDITKNEKGFSIILKKMRLHDMQIIVRMDDVHCL